MSKSLGIFISSDQHLDKIIKLCKAAKDKDIDVTIFFSHLGTLLTQEKRFDELKGLARMTLCKRGKKPECPDLLRNYYKELLDGQIFRDFCKL